MKLQQRTILITGGSSGIGLELSKQLLAKKNTIIICGRSAEKLADAKKLLPGVHIFKCDISVHHEREQLLQYVKEYHGTCDILINNAAIVHKSRFAEDDEIVAKAEAEINTNLVAPIVLSKMFLALFSNQSCIINITSGLVYVPRAVYPIYNATKAGLHSFTQTLRYQMKETGIQLVEVMMPVVDTPWHQGSPPGIAISPYKAVCEMITGIEKGRREIRIGRVKMLYALSRIAPRVAFKIINRIR